MIEQDKLDDLYAEMGMRAFEALDYLMLRTMSVDDEDEEYDHEDEHTLLRALIKSLRHLSDRMELSLVECEECGHDQGDDEDE